MSKFIAVFLVLYSGLLQVNAQRLSKDYYLKKSLKQDGLQFQFTVMEEGKRVPQDFDLKRFYYWYKAQKVLNTQGGASGQLLDGRFEAFYDNKQLAQKGQFKKGLKDGKWMYWHNNGNLKKIEHWQNGLHRRNIETFDEYGAQQGKIRYGRRKVHYIEKDSIFIIKRKHAQGEMETWPMEHGKWKTKKSFLMKKNENEKKNEGKKEMKQASEKKQQSTPGVKGKSKKTNELKGSVKSAPKKSDKEKSSFWSRFKLTKNKKSQS